jgi:hypothetical protein
MSKLDDIKFSGKSGNEYPFVVYSFDSNLSKIACVYVVTHRYKNESAYSHRIIYVGQTDNLPERFENHHKANCFKEKNANAICVHSENSEKKRLEIEADLIEKSKPDCNG